MELIEHFWCYQMFLFEYSQIKIVVSYSMTHTVWVILGDDEVLCSEYSLGFKNAYTTAEYEIEWNHSKSSVTNPHPNKTIFV